jgi:hypothetical protein
MSGATGIGVNDIGVDVAGNNTHSQGSEVQNVMTIANGLIGEVAQPRSEVIDNTIETFMTKATWVYERRFATSYFKSCCRIKGTIFDNRSNNGGSSEIGY